jgi:hypothetical protein
MKCPDCRHDLKWHERTGCYDSNDTENMCQCEKSRDDIYLTLLSEAKKVLEPLRELKDGFDKEWNEYGILPYIEMDKEDKNLINICEFLKKLEDSTAS